MRVVIQMYEGEKAFDDEIWLRYKESEMANLKVGDIMDDVKGTYLGFMDVPKANPRKMICKLYTRGNWMPMKMSEDVFEYCNEEAPDENLKLDAVFADRGKRFKGREPHEESVDQLQELPDFGAPRQAKRQKFSALNGISPSIDTDHALKFLSGEQLSVSANSFCLSVTQDLMTSNPPASLVSLAKLFLDNVTKAEEKGQRGRDVAFLKEERFYTTLFSEFLNGAGQGSVVFTHQASCGDGMTHMDFSGRKLDKLRFTSLVGEAKIGVRPTVRVEPLSENLNELIRSRATDEILNEEQHDLSKHCPVLLVLLNKSYISVRLAFFGKKGSIVEKFYKPEKEDITPGTEFFIAAELAFVHITRDDAGARKLARLAHFLVNTMERLHTCRDDLGKEAFLSKTPWISDRIPGVVEAVQYFGKNVTHVKFADKLTQYIYKEFCYYLRGNDGFNEPVLKIEEADRRVAPPQEVLDSLGEHFSWYKSWETVVDEKVRSITIIRYPYKKGSHVPQSVAQFLDVITQAKIIHQMEKVYGDYHPGNVLFNDTNGFTYDFDLMRNAGEPYIGGFLDNGYRHKEAEASKPTAKEHDVFALAKMAEFYFSCSIHEPKAFEDLGVLQLYLEKREDDLNGRERPVDRFGVATGSLNNQATHLPS